MLLCVDRCLMMYVYVYTCPRLCCSVIEYRHNTALWPLFSDVSILVCRAMMVRCPVQALYGQQSTALSPASTQSATPSPRVLAWPASSCNSHWRMLLKGHVGRQSDVTASLSLSVSSCVISLSVSHPEVILCSGQGFEIWSLFTHVWSHSLSLSLWGYLQHGLGQVYTRFSSSQMSAIVLTPVIVTRPESEVWCHHFFKALCSRLQMTHSGMCSAIPIAVHVCSWTAKCKHGVLRLAWAQLGNFH